MVTASRDGSVNTQPPAEKRIHHIATVLRNFGTDIASIFHRSTVDVERTHMVEESRRLLRLHHDVAAKSAGGAVLTGITGFVSAAFVATGIRFIILHQANQINYPDWIGGIIVFALSAWGFAYSIGSGSSSFPGPQATRFTSERYEQTYDVPTTIAHRPLTPDPMREPRTKSIRGYSAQIRRQQKREEDMRRMYGHS